MAFDRYFIRMLLAGLALLAAPAVSKAEPAPKLAVTLLDGSHFDLTEARGQIVIIHFWASWCPPCRAEMPLLDRFALSHPGVRVVGVSFDRRRDIGDVRKAMTGLSFPTAMAAAGGVNGFGEPRELPVTYVVDASGQIIARFAGGHPPLTEAALAAVVSASH